MTLDLTDEETAALAQFLRRTIDDDRYPLSPRMVPLKAILAKLEPAQSRPDPLPVLKPATRRGRGDADELLPPAADDALQRRCRQGPPAPAKAGDCRFFVLD
jgi:hypothetical protein